MNDSWLYSKLVREATGLGWVLVLYVALIALLRAQRLGPCRLFQNLSGHRLPEMPRETFCPASFRARVSQNGTGVQVPREKDSCSKIKDREQRRGRNDPLDGTQDTRHCSQKRCLMQDRCGSAPARTDARMYLLTTARTAETPK